VDADLRRVLLVEDDEDDALLVADLLEPWPRVGVEVVPSVAAAAPVLAAGGGDCVLLDLNLPDAVGLEALRLLLDEAPDVAIVVLTGDPDDRRGAAAVAAGAQDYLVKGAADGPALLRALRYAMERRAHERSQRELETARSAESENARLQRGLLPAPVVARTDVAVSAVYRPGQQRRLLGGDFLDAVEGADGVLHAMIADVCGHGPDEAALGARMRIAWRALVLAGTPAADLCPLLDRVLGLEREDDAVFLTMALVDVAPDAASATVRLAGHPPPILLDADGGASLADDCARGPTLGIGGPDPAWPATTVPLAGAWRVVLYTDGLYEGAMPGGRRPGLDELVDLVAVWAAGPPRLDTLVDAVEARNGGALTDDAAVLMLTAVPGP
jgi:serine phosphatase RsbU (regulator of sigma subunit)